MNIKKYVLSIRFWFDFKLFIALHNTRIFQKMLTILHIHTKDLPGLSRHSPACTESGPDRGLKKKNARSGYFVSIAGL